MRSTTRFVRYFSFIRAEHKVARVEVLKGDQWRSLLPPPRPTDSKHSNVAPTAESNLSSSTGNTSIADIRKGTTKGTPLLKSAYSKNLQILFCFSTNRLFTIVREKEYFCGRDGFVHFSFLIFWLLDGIRKEGEEFFFVMCFIIIFKWIEINWY